MDKEMEMEMKLWDYIDGNAPIAEKQAIEKLIANNLDWKAKYHELLDVRSLINAIDLEEPSLRFTKNVMEGIAKYNISPATKKYINNKIIWSIALFFIVAITGFLIYGIGQINWSAGNENNIISVDLARVDYSKMFNNTYLNIFMMLNVVLGLMLLDRFLANKRKRFQEA